MSNSSSRRFLTQTRGVGWKTSGCFARCIAYNGPVPPVLFLMIGACRLNFRVTIAALSFKP
jgi:hypothetical protein